MKTASKIHWFAALLPILGWLIVATIFEINWHNADPQHDTGHGFGAHLIYRVLPVPVFLSAALIAIGTKILRGRRQPSK